MVSGLLATTAFDIPGKEIQACLGIARGLTVRMPGAAQTTGAAFMTLGGGKAKGLTNVCEAARKEAYEAMMTEALQMGANAVIGVRYDSATVSAGQIDGTEVICYGTAVVVKT